MVVSNVKKSVLIGPIAYVGGKLPVYIKVLGEISATT
jgi:hypothetical protein